MDEGPASLAHSWDGFDMLLYANLIGQPLEGPTVGVGAPGMLLTLMEGGLACRAEFGGAGYEYMAALEAGAVYALLVPEGSTHFSMLAGDCAFTHAETLGHGQALYMMPEPATLVLLAVGGLLALVRRRRK